MMDAGARRQPVLGDRALARDQQRRRRVGDLRRHRGGEPAALHERAERPDLVEVGLARAFVERQAGERHDLAFEAALGAGPERASWDSTANASMSSRVMSHFSAIISAARNCETSCVP